MRYRAAKIHKGGSTMKMARTTLLGLALVFALVAAVQAADKEVTVKGTITCAKCDLKLDGYTKCATLIQVEEDGKKVNYFFDAAGDKKEHKNVCQASKKGTVTGTVAEKDGKKTITVTKCVYDK